MSPPSGYSPRTVRKTSASIAPLSDTRSKRCARVWRAYLLMIDSHTPFIVRNSSRLAYSSPNAAEKRARISALAATV